ncbi:MAG: hypothetical protein AAF950_18295 [Pseudomonadota bacterium]
MEYVGSGPYCFTNSLAMILGRQAPETSAIEVLTGAPFGALLLNRRIPFFSPGGWNPSIGIDTAVDLLGWTCQSTSEFEADEAIARLRAETDKAPVLVGPVEMGLLLHHPGSGTAIGADHYVVALGVSDEVVQFHDPHGFPYATLPIRDFLLAWRAESISYQRQPYAMRFDFSQVREVDLHVALRASASQAVSWLAKEEGGTSLVGEAALTTLAVQAEAGLEPDQHGHLVHFAVRVGARRLSDVSQWLGAIELGRASQVAAIQSQLLGRLQFDLVAGDSIEVADKLRKLAALYTDLRDTLETTA